MMRREDALVWFAELEGRAKSLPIEKFGMASETKAHEMQAFQAWMTEAETAIDGVFPPTHAIRTKWAKAEKSLSPFNDGAYVVGDAVVGVFQAAMSIIRSDRLGSLLDGIRVEAKNDLLDQAQSLLDSNYRAAATVIAGGALEIHLRNLCCKFGLTIGGDGSINKYDAAIAQARNLGTAAPYAATDSKQVSVWGGMRNDAAHDPGSFSRSKDEVRRLIDGIREFIPRTA